MTTPEERILRYLSYHHKLSREERLLILIDHLRHDLLISHRRGQKGAEFITDYLTELYEEFVDYTPLDSGATSDDPEDEVEMPQWASSFSNDEEEPEEEEPEKKEGEEPPAEPLATAEPHEIPNRREHRKR